MYNVIMEIKLSDTLRCYINGWQSKMTNYNFAFHIPFWLFFNKETNWKHFYK